MKKFFITLIFSLISTVSFAGNGYCDGRPSAREVQRCYVNAVQSQNGIMNSLVEKIMASNKITHQDKAELDKHIEDWSNRVNSTCRSDVCIYNSLVDYNRQLNNYYIQYAK